jgi:uncharacterized repeat protein (TIGR03837 family)
MNQKFTWDIFCRVIDNFGDIGVCWRLARQLAVEHQQSVRLWVDDLHSLMRIWPDAADLPRQWLAGVDVHRWPEQFPANIDIAQVVIEAFACDIPHSYLQAMAASKLAGTAPTWINLEYLSAENWVEGCHLMASVHPSTGLRKSFFFPGFTAATGGLLREHNLIEDRDRFDKSLFLNSIGIRVAPETLLVSLFAYENPAIGSLLAAWSASTRPVHCLVPQGRILGSINQTLTRPLESGNPHISGNLRLEVIPFLTQTQYDHLLWACDINFVRGEDSFVRAQWAAKPFVWHIYPQDEQAHMVKLNAFLKLFLTDKSHDFASNLRASWQNWNEFGDMRHCWEGLIRQLPEWQAATCEWSQGLADQTDLASQLMNLVTHSKDKKSTTEKPQSPV